jgi:alpha-mannosidase
MSADSNRRPRQGEGLPPVYAATYDHLGIILWRVDAIERTLDAEIDRLERHPGFRVGWDHEAYTYDHLAEHAPHLLEKMKAALANYRNRLGVGSCTYGQPLSRFINEESNVRQLTMALDAVERQLGYRVSVYIVSEHAFHCQMPQLLVGCGFRGAILRTHFMMYGYCPTYEAPVGWWVGIDGSRLPALPTYPGQASAIAAPQAPSSFGAVTLDNRILTDGPDTFPMTLASFRERFGPRIRPLVATRADDPRSHEEIITAHEGDPDYIWVLAEGIFELLPQPRVEFRTQPDDFHVRMPWGYCGNWIWNRSRQAEVSVLTAERLAAIGSALEGPGYEQELDAAWRQLLVGQHHDVQICGLEDDARTYLGCSLERSGAVTERVMRAVAPRIGGAGRRTVVFNPLAWERADWVATQGGGQVVSVPALAFMVVGPGEEATPAPDFDWQPEVGRLITPFYEVHAGQTGGIDMLRDRATGASLLKPGEPSGTLAGLIDGVPRESAGGLEAVRVERERVVLVERGEVGGICYRSDWTFYARMARIDWHGELEIHGQRIGRLSADEAEPRAGFEHEHKLRVRFYPDVSPDTVGIHDFPFGVATTSAPVVEGIYWTAMSDGHVGLALLNRGLMGSLVEPDGAFSSILAYSMYYVWGTRILEGVYSYDLGLLPFLGNWRGAHVHRRAIEYNFPCVAISVSESQDSLGDLWSPYRDDGGQAILSALYTRQGTTYARFYECAGESADVVIHWMGQPTRLTEVDLRRRVLSGLGGQLTLGPWQVRTVALEAA